MSSRSIKGHEEQKTGEQETVKLSPSELDDSTLVVRPTPQQSARNPVDQAAESGPEGKVSANHPEDSEATQAEATSTPDDELCPKCGSQLSEGLTLGWCQQCGYCRYMEGARQGDAARAERAAAVAALFAKPPVAEPEAEWIPTLLCGVIIIVLGSLIAAVNLREHSQARLLWCIGQATLGGLALCVSYFWVFLQLAPRGQRKQHLTKFFSPALCMAAWNQLPRTRWPICLAAWAACFMIAALFTQLLFGIGTT